MKEKQFIEINIDGEKFNVKPYLTTFDTQFIIRESVNAYMNGLEGVEDDVRTDNIPNIQGNPVMADFAFNVFLVAMTCKELSELEYDTLLSNGIHDILMEEVRGAKRAKEHVENAIKEINSLENVLMKSVSMLIEKIPTTKDMQKLSKSLIKELANPKNVEVVKNLKEVLVVNKEL